ncbi:hypothetical protein M758_7G041800 [Ceratodon purpureus]|nr:hypothetical protein M758_7G041800 [Ceratodon purpureus]
MFACGRINRPRPSPQYITPKEVPVQLTTVVSSQTMEQGIVPHRYHSSTKFHRYPPISVGCSTPRLDQLHEATMPWPLRSSQQRHTIGTRLAPASACLPQLLAPRTHSSQMRTFKYACLGVSPLLIR